MGDRLQTGKPSRYITNSAFHPFGVGKSSTGFSGWDYGEARSPVSSGRKHARVILYGWWRSISLR